MKKFLLGSVLLLSFAAHAAPYKLDAAHTSVGFSVKHLMISNVKGHFDKYEGGVDFDSAKKTVKNIVINIDAASINTGVKDRDDHLRGSDFFDVAKFPKITFKADSMKWNADGKTGVVSGKLTMKDKTLPQDLNVTFNGEAEFMGVKKIAFTANGTIEDRTKFGLSWNKPLNQAGGLTVGNSIEISIEGEANLDAPAKK